MDSLDDSTNDSSKSIELNISEERRTEADSSLAERDNAASSSRGTPTLSYEDYNYEEDELDYDRNYDADVPVIAFLKQELVTEDMSDSENSETAKEASTSGKRSMEAYNSGDNYDSEMPTPGRKRRTIWYNENTIKHLKEEISGNGLKLYGCAICDKQFGQGNSALRHIAVVHFNAKQFSCDVCGKLFSQMSNLKQHIDSIHVADYSYVCEIENCGRRFKSNNQLNQHRKVVHEKREFCQCDICHRPFHTRKGLMTHKKTKHEQLALM
ncbi:zinc finger protein OZF-like protein [Leptotrombidium deliense]|uniref:Zinc finger protein OZF-like protein n=1 Tax=Leptotrombidium deliense TaxID=299467 RepID=A0A443RUZ7_9ACAR|nr:zinc finger protein OZF-like protein [Leptotrombidium deliense]